MLDNGGRMGHELNMKSKSQTSNETIRQLANYLLDPESNNRPFHVTPTQSGGESQHPLMVEANSIPFEGKPSLSNASKLTKGFSGHHEFAPKACEEASQNFSSYQSGTDNLDIEESIRHDI
ncbi:hypothetical protein Lwal_0534 [Legionella waltersii]|uniref:Uncharacterized protein n=2 Tax=Legionella waltersii TaxID=66969 RepID=A0A0W1AMN3_9GAMM|nr:hypothetical protein Lwal_0534 [Legionella waltersii]SNV02706.1 Uncharacterised protein [Legionella waltersii]